MKFSGKMCFEIILKITIKQGFTLSLEDTFFAKTTREEGGGEFDPPLPGILVLSRSATRETTCIKPIYK